jgi:hypothetical protein
LKNLVENAADEQIEFLGDFDGINGTLNSLGLNDFS